MADTSGDRDYTVAMVAAILAAVAFIVAFFQALLEYLSSGTARAKTNAAAIGPSSRLVKWRWSPRDWKLRVYYPLIDMDYENVWKQANVKRDFVGNEGNLSETIQKFREKNGSCGWRSIRTGEKLSYWHIATTLDVLSGTKRNGSIGPISIMDLDWKGKLQFLRYRWSHRWRPLQIPRASWAQLLLAAGIEDTHELKLRMVDADTVHANLDAPTQRITLRKLGFFAFRLGFTSITIDVDNRKFEAISPYGTITTENIENLGKVIRFDGDILAIRRQTDHDPALYSQRAAAAINGQLSFGELTSNGVFIPLSLLLEALRERWSSTQYDEQERLFMVENCDTFIAGPMLRESRLFGNLMRDQTGPPLEKAERTPIEKDQSECSPDEVQSVARAVRTWTETTELSCPTLLAAAMVATFSAVVCGFPSRILLAPFRLWINERAKSLRRSPCLKSLAELKDATRRSTIPFFSKNTAYYMDGHTFKRLDGLCGWGSTPLDDYFEQLPEAIQNQIKPTAEDGDPHAVVLPETLWLLESYDPVAWKTRVSEQEEERGWIVRPQNLVWLQIFLVDIAIQLLICGKLKSSRDENAEIKRRLEELQRHGPLTSKELLESLEPFLIHNWGREQIEVVDAIVKWWRPSYTQSEASGAHEDSATSMNQQFDFTPVRDGRREDEPSGTDIELTTPGNVNSSQQQLQGPKGKENGEPAAAGVLPGLTLMESLHANEKIFSGCSAEERTRKCARLADLLEIRALFFLAYLYLHPDSTDVYISEGKGDIEVPIA